MIRSRWVWLVLLLWALPAAGEPEEQTFRLRFRVYPPDAEVYRVTGDGEEHLGPASGVQLPVKYATGPSTFIFKRPGFRFPETYGWKKYLPVREATGSFYDYFPIDGAKIEGQPESLTVALGTYALFYPQAVLIPFVLLSALGFFLGKILRDRARGAAHAQKREALRQTGGIDPMVGQTVGRYMVLDRIGTSQMTAVFKAIPEDSLEPGDAVAIRIMKITAAEDPDFARRFQREVQISLDLKHPNILRVDDWGEQKGTHFLVMEYASGTTLDALIPKDGMSVAQALPYLEAILDALIYAHGRGVIHRDLKPENILILENGGLKVMGFGTARAIDVSSVSAGGQVFGTPAYMSPEQISGATPRPSWDQYAFGVLMYETLTGHRPFEGGDSAAVLAKHLKEPPPSPREWKPSLSEPMEAFILRLLEKDPTRRLLSLEVVKNGLLAVAVGEDWKAQDPPTIPDRTPAHRKRPSPPESGDGAR